jgi:hypothetical protein
MRTLELTTRLNPVQRSQGDSATAKAAYRACCEIECEREGRTHDYSRKRGHEAGGIVLPKGAAAWAKDRGKLWNGAELAERNGKRGKNAGAFKANAQTARDLMFSYPFELSQPGRLRVAGIVAARLVDAHGIGVDFNIHEPGKDGDEKNYHCHMLLTTRRIGPDGFGEKAREWDDLKTGPKLMRDLRAFIAATLNAELKAEGKAGAVFVEHRSFEARGSGQKPQQHQGPGKTHALRKQQGQARAAWFKRVQAEQRERHGKELAGLKLRQDFGLQAKQMELARRGSEGAKAIRRELDAQRRADTAPDGLRRVFLVVTGRAGREAFDRQARDALRIADAREKLGALKAELRAERHAYGVDQIKERAALIERHGGEDRQLSQALVSREGLDRTREVVARTPDEQTRSHERDREGPGRSISQDFTLH